MSAFLVAGFIGLLFAPVLAVPYALATFILGARVTRLPLRWWPVIPFAFAAHHLTYWVGLLTGILGKGERSPQRHRDTEGDGDGF